jgi:uncharacterized protein (TIGR02246 family)
LISEMGLRRDHTALVLPVSADRLAIRELVDAYACCAERRDAPGLQALFTEDVDFVVYADRGSPVPTQKLRGRSALASICHELDADQATVHINGQSTARIGGARASGLTFCLVYHQKIEETAHTVMIAAIRYLDSYVKRDGRWLIRRRRVMVDWTETRTLTTADRVGGQFGRALVDPGCRSIRRNQRTGRAFSEERLRVIRRG